MSDQEFLMFVGLVCVVVGVIVIALFLRASNEANESKAQCTATVPGVVSRLIEEEDNDGTLWKPVFSYTVGKENYTIVSPVSSRPAQYQVGEHVVVGYNPLDPSNAYVHSERGSGCLLYAFIGAGLIDAAAGLAVVICAALGVIG